MVLQLTLETDSSSMGLSTVDNLLVVHNLGRGTAMLFDVLAGGASPLADASPVHQQQLQQADRVSRLWCEADWVSRLCGARLTG